MNAGWKWPGSKWWKCDLHLHTPASEDFTDRNSVTVTDWVNAVATTDLDAVAVTDHNTGELVDEIKQAISQSPRPIAIFPSVEISVSPGVHLLAIFDPTRDCDSVTALLGSCGVPDALRGTKDAIATCSITDAMEKAVERGAVCIGAHVNDEKGILKVIQPGQSLQHIITSENLHAVEVNVENGNLLQSLDNTKDGYRRLAGPISIVTFSDAHALKQIGRRFTWIKMTRPDLEGLRLAFQDGPWSVVGFDKMTQDPNAHASHVVESIEIQNSKYIGRGTAFEARFNPWLNTIIGGRGTGKSSLVEFLRIALRRENELPEKLQKDFEDFKRLPRGREDKGLLLPENTRASVVYRKEGQRFRIQWDFAGTMTPIQEEGSDKSWHQAEGEVRRRFPIRIYSQKQIFEMATGPEALLGIIDDAAEINRVAWNEEWHEEEARFLALRAKVREVETGLAEEGRIKGELDDVKRKLEVFESSGHSEILREYQQRKRQARTIDAWQEGFDGIGNRLREVAAQSVPETVDLDGFSRERVLEGEVLTLADSTSAKLRELKRKIIDLAAEADGIVDTWKKELSQSVWQKTLGQAEANYTSLVEKLRGAGAGDPTEYGRLVQERQRLEQRLAGFEGRRKALADIQKQAEDSLSRLSDLRRTLTQNRSRFLQSVVGANPHVHVEVIPYGDKNRAAEAGFRNLIQTDRFQSDILADDGQSGLLADLYDKYSDSVSSTEFEARLKNLKHGLFDAAQSSVAPVTFRDQRFAKHLASLKPEAFDRLDSWFPDDSLKVSYSPRTDGQAFRPIEQASPGQKTAAILAFLLSYGEEPMVLDQPEDDLDNHLIYDLIVRQLREKKHHRQIIVVTHNANIVVNGDAELVLALDVRGGQTRIAQQGGLQEQAVRDEICRVMEGGREAFELRYRRIGQGASHV